MDARLQRRVQRYGWDLAADTYEPLWQAQLSRAQSALLERAALQHGERVLDVACGTGLVTFEAARAVGAAGSVLGVDLSGRMVQAARHNAQSRALPHVRFERMDAEALVLPEAGFDAALCALGLMYVPEPEQALRGMHRALRPGGRIALSVWGERAHCGWAPLFEIVQDEVHSEVCPMFFRLGQPDLLARACTLAGFEAVAQQRIGATLNYTGADDACRAAFVGGPVALAWSRFDAATRARVSARYLESIDAFRDGTGYRVPGEFVVVTGVRPPG